MWGILLLLLVFWRFRRQAVAEVACIVAAYFEIRQEIRIFLRLVGLALICVAQNVPLPPGALNDFRIMRRFLLRSTLFISLPAVHLLVAISMVYYFFVCQSRPTDVDSACQMVLLSINLGIAALVSLASLNVEQALRNSPLVTPSIGSLESFLPTQPAPLALPVPTPPPN